MFHRIIKLQFPQCCHFTGYLMTSLSKFIKDILQSSCKHYLSLSVIANDVFRKEEENQSVTIFMNNKTCYLIWCMFIEESHSAYTTVHTKFS